MKQTVFSLLILSVIALAGCGEQQRQKEQPQGSDIELDTHEKRLSYATAYDFHKQVMGNGLPLDMDVFLMGLKDAFGDAKPRMTEAEMNADIKVFVEDMESRRPKFTIEKSEDFDRVVSQAAFMSAHMQKSGVTTLPNGLQLEVLRDADGPRPTQSDMVRVKYRGTLWDGTEFDASDPEGSSVFPVSGVIKGWSEALKMMPVGAKWQLVIPPDLAYGDAGYGDKIPGKAVLIFDIELLEILGKTN
jgi:FKBP-type peptidyl-prolyl cis-trans isomerase